MIDEFCEKPNISSVSEPLRMFDTCKELLELLAQDWGRWQWGEKWRSQSWLETKDALQGNADNQVIWLSYGVDSFLTVVLGQSRAGLIWISNLSAW